MTAATKRTIWQQWDHQTNDREIAYIALNNLYLSIERGIVAMSIHTRNELIIDLSTVYPENDFWSTEIKNHWMAEFQKLPNWNKV